MINDLHMWLSFAVIIAAMILYVGEWLAIELVSLLVIIALISIFSLIPNENLSINDLLSGFGNPALISVMALLVMGQGLFHSGALERLLGTVAHHATHHPLRMGALTLITVTILSACLNNTPVVLMFLPVVVALMHHSTQRHGAGFAMGLSYFSILGGMITLIGSSTNLLVADTAMRNGAQNIGFFAQTPMGLILATTGMAFLFFFMPRLLGARTEPTPEKTDSFSGHQFIIEMRLRSDSTLIGTKSAAGIFAELAGVTIQAIDSPDGMIFPPFDDYTLQAGDRLFIAATRRQLTDAMANKNHPLHIHIAALTQQLVEKQDTLFAEIVVAPGSRMTTRSIHQTGFAHDTDTLIIGVQRRARMARYMLGDIRLEAGDVLLIIGAQNRIEALRNNRDALLMEWSAREIPNFARAIRARWIFAIAILCAALNIIPIVLAALGGATAMILSRALNIRQAVRAIDMRIFLLIGTALAMASALSATGGAQYLANQFLAPFESASPAIILSAFFLLCAIITNLLSNTATAVLFTPIALKIAQSLDVAPEAFIFAVIFAANCSFATPIGYQTNLLVMGVGNLRFRDFLRVGTPLVIVIWITYSLIAPFYYGLTTQSVPTWIK